jgi:putative membrane protein
MESVNMKNQKTNYFFDWLLYMVGYAIVLITVSLIFKKNIYIDPEYYGLWGLVTAIIIYVLNKTIKPVLVWLTLPITGLTLGLFYPFINVFILNIADFLLGNHFEIHGIFISFIVACLISLMNGMMESLVIEPIIRKGSSK